MVTQRDWLIVDVLAGANAPLIRYEDMDLATLKVGVEAGDEEAQHEWFRRLGLLGY